MSYNSYNDFMALARDRFSCRDYDSARPVSDNDVSRVLEAARISPSACNSQPWHFFVVRDSAVRAAMLAKSRPAFVTAPVLIVCCGVHTEAWHRPADNKDHTDIDMAIAIQQMCLAATAAGMATCWICSFDTQAVRDALTLPEYMEPVALLPLGYANTAIYPEVPQKIRKSLDDIVTCI